jgi:hypothetical protein
MTMLAGIKTRKKPILLGDLEVGQGNAPETSVMLQIVLQESEDRLALARWAKIPQVVVEQWTTISEIL